MGVLITIITPIALLGYRCHCVAMIVNRICDEDLSYLEVKREYPRWMWRCLGDYMYGLVELERYEGWYLTSEQVSLMAKLDLEKVELFESELTPQAARDLSEMPRLKSLLLMSYHDGQFPVPLTFHISEPALAELVNSDSLESLTIMGAEVPANTPSLITKLHNLRRLVLDEIEIGDTDLEPLKELSSLSSLTLGWENLSDDDLLVLSQLTQLKELSIFSPNVSESAIDDLRKKMPACRIDFVQGFDFPWDE